MGFFVTKRLGILLLTLLLASGIVFVMLEVLPGNAAQVMLGPDAAPQAIRALEQQLGLHQPAIWRYLHWLGDLLQGQMGTSLAYNTPVADLLMQRLTLTLPLALLAMVFTTVLALFAGMLAAAQHRKVGDYAVMTVSQLAMAIPGFWFALLLILIFSVHLQWFRAGGFDGWGDSPIDFIRALQSLLLPALALATVQTALLTRITRTATLEVLHEDFVRTARARGLSKSQTLLRHVLRNASIPILTFMGLQFTHLLTGAIVIENVFFLPGLGRLILQSIANRDLVVVRGCVLLLVALVLVFNFLMDMLHVVIDPRLRHYESNTVDGGS